MYFLVHGSRGSHTSGILHYNLHYYDCGESTKTVCFLEVGREENNIPPGLLEGVVNLVCSSVCCRVEEMLFGC